MVRGPLATTSSYILSGHHKLFFKWKLKVEWLNCISDLRHNFDSDLNSTLNNHFVFGSLKRLLRNCMKLYHIIYIWWIIHSFRILLYIRRTVLELRTYSKILDEGVFALDRVHFKSTNRSNARPLYSNIQISRMFEM